MASSLVKIAPFSILLLLFMFVYSLLGMQMFGGKLGSPPPRHNYDSLLWSFVTTFQVRAPVGDGRATPVETRWHD